MSLDSNIMNCEEQILSGRKFEVLFFAVYV